MTPAEDNRDPITREQLAAILWQFAKNQGYDVSAGESTNILSGDGAKLNPQGQATRAQAAVMLTAFCEEYLA